MHILVEQTRISKNHKSLCAMPAPIFVHGAQISQLGLFQRDVGHGSGQRLRHRAQTNHNSAHRRSISMDVAKMAYNFTIHDPYYNADVRKLLLSCTFDQLHKPREKSIAYIAFEEYWRQGKWYRLRENLQVGTGLREWHDTMLASTINTRQSKAIIGIYNDILISS